MCILLSQYGAASVTPSPVNEMMASFSADFREGIDINLGVGYVNEDTIPRSQVLEATEQILSSPDKYRIPLNYGASGGSKNLLKSLRRFLVNNKIAELNEEILSTKKLIIGSNGATSLLEGIAQVLIPGIVVTADPIYYIYGDYLERIGYKILAIPEDEHGINIQRFEEKMNHLRFDRNDIRFFYIVGVNNPTCTLLSNARIEEVINVVSDLSKQLGRMIPLIIDRAYECLIHHPHIQPLRSGFFYDNLGLVYEIGTLSKILAPGLRIGYMIGNEGPFMSSMIQRTSDVGFSAASINQEIASYLLDHYGKKQIGGVKEAYRKKAIFVNSLIDQYLREHLYEVKGGEGGFYYYLTLKNIETHSGSPFYQFLSRTTGIADIDGPPNSPNSRVAYIPGTFCVHPHGELKTISKRQLRLSYAYENEGHLEKAMMLMQEAAEFASACQDRTSMRKISTPHSRGQI